MAWVYLGLASIFEVLFAMSMKYAKGFTIFWPSVLVFVGVIAGVSFLTLALKTLPVSIAYPIWTAAGTLGTVFLGYWLLGESLGTLKVISILLIMIGIIGLKTSMVVDEGSEPPPASVQDNP